jgi:transposase-like protein
MAATRLTDSQKIEIVARYRSGEVSAELAEAYGCSTNTVSRVVKAGLEPAEYEQLKQQRNRPLKVSPEQAAPELALSEPEPLEPEPLEPEPLELELPEPELPEPAGDDEDHALLAIDDADDFGDDANDLDFADDDLADQFVAVPLLLVDHVGEPAQCQPLADAPLPASVYMLVDKTVELQAKPLKDFPELGQLPDGEEDRQALMVFANPRQAKRHCGRTQRVIKVPDTRILERTAPYLIAQGISRVVMEGSLYSLPGS